MTSSLVGSEMCIRDSLLPFPLAPTWRSRSIVNQTVYLASTEAARDPHPVSYTHLTLPTICSV
eukprot:9024359-Prorocentrum_lima.AAC.1